MTQLAEKLHPWVARRRAAAPAARAGCRTCANAARRPSPRSGFRRCATRNGASPTWRRSPPASSVRPPIAAARRGRHRRRCPTPTPRAAAGGGQRPLRAGAVAPAGCRAACASARWRAAINGDCRPTASRPALSRPARRLQQPRVRGAQHRLPRGRRLRPRPRRRRARGAAADPVRVGARRHEPVDDAIRAR